MDFRQHDDHRERFRVVLVEPEDSANIGAVARAMANLGFRNLRLVAPRHFERERADVVARGPGAAVLDAATIHPTLDDALADTVEAVALSLRGGSAGDAPENPACVTLPRWADGLRARPLPAAVALVFGPEENGLAREHLDRCRWAVRIPSEESLSAYNLAQSALLALYETARALDALPSPRPEAAREAARPTANDLRQLDRHLDAVMARVGFTGKPAAPARPAGRLRALLRRADPSAADLAALLALVARVRAVLDRDGD